MAYNGWVVSFVNVETGKREWKGSFCVIDEATKVAQELKEKHRCVQILQLVYDPSIQA